MDVTSDTTKRQINVSASDSVSGMSRVVYRYRPVSSSSWSSEIRMSESYWKDGTPFLFNRIGDYELKITAYDNAGNTSVHLTGDKTWGSTSEIDGNPGNNDGTGGIGSVETEGSPGVVGGDINVYRQYTPNVEVVIINGTEDDGSEFDKKILGELYAG